MYLDLIVLLVWLIRWARARSDQNEIVIDDKSFVCLRSDGDSCTIGRNYFCVRQWARLGFCHRTAEMAIIIWLNGSELSGFLLASPFPFSSTLQQL